MLHRIYCFEGNLYLLIIIDNGKYDLDCLIDDLVIVDKFRYGNFMVFQEKNSCHIPPMSDNFNFFNLIFYNLSV